MSQQGEFQGFVSVKIPSCMKSRSFIPWKTWKRQWVVVRRSRSTRNGVELLIGRSSPTVVQISADDVICRTESRTQHYAFGVFSRQSKRRASVYLSGTSETDTQKWIAKIRKLLKPPLLPVEENEFSVSVVDNFFSRSAGLSGLYGTLRISPDRVSIVDPFTSKNKVEWPWSSLSQFRVPSTSAPEDEGHICTVVTSRVFPAGTGEIHLFCLEGVALAGKLKGRGRAASLLSSAEGRLSAPHRHHTFSCNAPEGARDAAVAAPGAALFGRRLSRSEGNLLCALGEVDFLDGRRNRLEGHDSEDKTSIDSTDYFFGKGKIGPGILSAGLGLFLSTPGGSEGDTESLREFQKLQNGDSDDEFASLSLGLPPSKLSPPRRESGVSIASGVYEEIDDFSIDVGFSSLDLAEDGGAESPPPPLPPRRAPSCRTVGDCDGYGTALLAPPVLGRFPSRSAGSTPLPSPPCPPKSRASADALAPKSASWNGPQDSDYLPMLPGCAFFGGTSKTDFASKESLEDQHYMVMASIKGT